MKVNVIDSHLLCQVLDSLNCKIQFRLPLQPATGNRETSPQREDRVHEKMTSLADATKMTQIDASSLAALSEARDGLVTRGYAFVSGAVACAALGVRSETSGDFSSSWNELALDTYLADGGKYRWRRHASLLQDFEPSTLTEVDYRPLWQP
jgi:hypothetical protein